MQGRKIPIGKDQGPPKNPRVGQLHYDYATRTIRKWNGSNWVTEVKPGEISKGESRNGKA